MNLPFFGIKDEQVVDFAHNLSMMLKSGLGISESLSQLARSKQKGKFKKILSNLEEQVRTGTSLSEALSEYENVFGSVFIGLVQAGENAGNLDEVLSYAADWKKRNLNLEKKVSNATLYPKFLIFAVLFVGGAVSLYVLPKIIPVFRRLGTDLPLSTRLLIDFTNLVQSFWWVALLVIIGVYFLYKTLKNFDRARYYIDKIFLKTPFLGSFFINYQLALIAHVLSILLKSGVPIQQALRISSFASTNLVYQKTLQETKEEVTEGNTISEVLEKWPKLYPNNMIAVIRAGEDSGSLDENLDYLSHYYSGHLVDTAERLPTILEPVILIVIGFFVAFIAISILQPIYSLSRGF